MSSSKPASRRVRREQRTIEVMIRMYCRAGHPGAEAAADYATDDTTDGPDRGDRGGGDRGDLCPGCAELLDYSRQRIGRCSFGDQKPTCARCTVHCFRLDMRTRIRAVMRYSGPRTTIRHPYLAVRHLLDRRNGPR
jgi:hypothetical protein